jgi:HEAT repeat protein
MHATGYVREAAVEVLSVSDDPLAVAFLLIRANDWVAPVRDAAARGIARHLSAGGAASFITYIDLLDGLTRAGRNELQPLAERIRAALASPASASALKAGCASGSRSVRRRCFEIAFSTRKLDPTRLVSAGLDDPDPLIRILSAKRAKALDWTDVEPLIDDMLASTTPAARFFALEILWNRNGVASRPVQERVSAEVSAAWHSCVLQARS